MFTNNNLKLTAVLTTSNTKRFLVDIPMLEKRKNKKGINLFYNSKLNAISGLCIKQTFTKSLLNIFLEKKRENAVKYIFDFQSQSFYNLLVLNKKINVFLKNNFSYKILRLAAGLPIRGQRTHTNAKTARKLNKVYT